MRINFGRLPWVAFAVAAVLFATGDWQDAARADTKAECIEQCEQDATDCSMATSNPTACMVSLEECKRQCAQNNSGHSSGLNFTPNPL